MAKKDNKSSEEIITQNITYKKVPDHKTFYAHGALVGPSPRLDINLQFFIENYTLPDKWKKRIYPDGRMEEDSIPGDARNIERTITVTVSLNPGVAESVAKLLTDKTESMKKQLKEAIDNISGEVRENE